MKESHGTDTENPTFDFGNSRSWQTGDPKSSDSARLFRSLRSVVGARQAGKPQELDEAVHTFKGVLDAYVKG